MISVKYTWVTCKKSTKTCLCQNQNFLLYSSLICMTTKERSRKWTTPSNLTQTHILCESGRAETTDLQGKQQAHKLLNPKTRRHEIINNNIELSDNCNEYNPLTKIYWRESLVLTITVIRNSNNMYLNCCT